MKQYLRNDFVKDVTNLRALPANILSLSRLAAPLIIPPLATSGNLILVIIISLAFFLTDFLDGKLARLLNGKTALGAKLDQITDKVCALGLLLGLTPHMHIMIIPFILEFCIVFANARIVKTGQPSDSTWNGKLKMWPLSITIIAGYGALATAASTLNLTLLIITHACLIVSIIFEIVNIKEYNENYKKIIAKTKSQKQAS